MVKREIEGLMFEVFSPSHYRMLERPFTILYEITGWWVYHTFEDKARICHMYGYATLADAVRMLSVALRKAG